MKSRNKYGKNFIVVMVVLLVFGIFPINSFANQGENYNNANPSVVKTWYREVWAPYLFYRDGSYRGWLGLAGKVPPKVSYQDSFVYLYRGTLYHDSVESIPAPAKKDNDLELISDRIPDKIKTSTKFISKIYKIPCRWDQYCGIPDYVFYNDGTYRGYLYYKPSYPAYKRENYIEVTYKGYVTTGDYPSPGKVINVER